MSALQRLPQNEETTLLTLVKENGLEASKLMCEYTRQQGAGVGRTRRRLVYDISYDLRLCRLCGNLPKSGNNTPYCPFKMNVLKTRLLSE